jgi:hypothetical protein
MVMSTYNEIMVLLKMPEESTNQENIPSCRCSVSLLSPEAWFCPEAEASRNDLRMPCFSPTVYEQSQTPSKGVRDDWCAPAARTAARPKENGGGDKKVWKSGRKDLLFTSCTARCALLHNELHSQRHVISLSS